VCAKEGFHGIRLPRAGAGYRIVKAYYEHAPDKHQALREICEIKDPKAFLARSGWRSTPR
jgi:hypothetical protein